MKMQRQLDKQINQTFFAGARIHRARIAHNPSIQYPLHFPHIHTKPDGKSEVLFTSILALIKYFTCQPSQLQGKHESHDKNDQSKGIDQGSQTNIDYLTKEGKHLP